MRQHCHTRVATGVGSCHVAQHVFGLVVDVLREVVQVLLWLPHY
jgi:hypothetical protein